MSNKKTPAGEMNEYSLERQDDVATNLDPQLQKVILKTRAGQPLDSAGGRESVGGDALIDVIAKLRDPEREVPGLKVVRVMGDVVTGEVAVGDIEAVRGDPNVISLKGARRLERNLKFSVPEVHASQQQLRDALPAGAPAINGSGVVVGIVDYGCDFVHNNLRNADGTTRILYLWDQGAGTPTAISPVGFGYGREWGAKELNAALKSADPYQALSYDPGSGAHGTHVMDIAAGNGRATGSAGMAPLADIIFVQVASNDFSDEESFGNSRHLLEAVDYVFTKAAALSRSAVVNLSLGTNGGPHDGSTPVEEGLDNLLGSPGRAVVIAASNSWGDRIHAAGKIGPGQKRTLKWDILANDPTTNELEIWYAGQGKLDVSLTDPKGKKIGPFPIGTTTKIKIQGQEAGAVFHRQKDPNNGDNQVDILLGPSLPTGRWGVTLSAAAGSPAAEFHAWIERDDYQTGWQSTFSAQDDDRTHTVGSISCGRNTLVVGSYDATVPGRDISSFSSEGPTRDGRQKPEVSAPGHGIYAARSSTQGVMQMWGTSMAAPHVTGLVALLMQAAHGPLSVKQIRDAVIGRARRTPPPGDGWSSRYGQGRIDAVAILLTQFAHLPAPHSAVAGVGGDATPVKPNGHAPLSFDELLSSLVKGTSNSSLRLKFEVEVEPATVPTAFPSGDSGGEV
jgi:subtilisin family serine protease